MKKVELLAPAGNLEKLKMAVHYGADAVYLAGQAYGLRSWAGNFSLDEMAEGIQFAHENGVKVYVTVNILAHNQDLTSLPEYLLSLKELKIDGIIVADPGIVAIAQEIIPKIPIHISTQANITNWASAKFWGREGIKRIVLARELSLLEIQDISQKIQTELEVFVHGAMCISYSGRCLLSNYMTGRDANKGECAQPCRWSYALVEQQRPGEYYPVFEDERGTYIFNSRDLCLIEHLPELIKAGVNSFKIEGRMKSVHYVATIVNAYRKAIDAYFENPEKYQFQPSWLTELKKISHRDYTTGFLFGKPEAKDHNYNSSDYLRAYDFVGVVLDYNEQKGWAIVEQRNHFKVGDEIEFMGPETEVFHQKLEEIINQEGVRQDAAPHPRQIIQIPVNHPVKPWDIMRRARDGH